MHPTTFPSSQNFYDNLPDATGVDIKGRQSFPLALDAVPKSLEDTMFQVLKDMEKPTPPLTHSPRPQWISERKIILIDARVDHRR